MSREVDMSKVEKGSLSREEALYLRDRGLLPEDYDVPGDGEDVSYKDLLKALSDSELKERADGAGIDLSDDRVQTKGKVSKTKLIAAMVEMHENAQNPINAEADADGDDED